MLAAEHRDPSLRGAQRRGSPGQQAQGVMWLIAANAHIVRMRSRAMDCDEAEPKRYVTKAKDREACLDQQIAGYIKVSDAFAAEHGSLADEFSTL